MSCNCPGSLFNIYFLVGFNGILMLLFLCQAFFGMPVLFCPLGDVIARFPSDSISSKLVL